MADMWDGVRVCKSMKEREWEKKECAVRWHQEHKERDAQQIKRKTKEFENHSYCVVVVVVAVGRKSPHNKAHFQWRCNLWLGKLCLFSFSFFVIIDFCLGFYLLVRSKYDSISVVADLFFFCLRLFVACAVWVYAYWFTIIDKFTAYYWKFSNIP